MLLGVNEVLFNELKSRLADWTPLTKIGDAMALLAPYLKMYSAYAKKYQVFFYFICIFIIVRVFCLFFFNNLTKLNKIKTKIKTNTRLPSKTSKNYYIMIVSLQKHTRNVKQPLKLS